MKQPFAILFVLIQLSAAAQIRLPKLISNGMILQRDTKIKIWGWASPNEKITILFKQKKYSTVANENGDWQVLLPQQHADTLPTTMKLSASNEIILTDILFGDVWLCSGQSNMEQPMGGRLKYKYAHEIATANNKFIRQFLVPDKYDFIAPQKDVESGSWKTATTENMKDITAIGYFFAKQLFTKYNVPIGLLNAALGGSPAEAWISEASLKTFPEYLNEMQKFKDKNFVTQTESNDSKASSTWSNYLNENDEGEKLSWKSTSFNDNEWRQINMPSNFENFSSGVVWLRKEIMIPASMINKPTKLELGRIIDADSVFINGQFVGNTTYQYPARRYELNNTILKEGKNNIVIRVVVNSSNGGFVKDKKYELTTATDTINLSGGWKYKVGVTALQSAPATTNIRWKPGGLHNAMIAPLTNYEIKGSIWYQGETNANYPSNYAAVMQTLITDWRNLWQQNFPFLFVQLPNYMNAKPTPQTDSKWTILRQQQLQTLQVPNTAMAAAIDLGEWNDIHPENKKDVAYRLSLLARKIAYNEKKLIASGPLYQSMKIEGNKIILAFTNIGTGLISKNGSELKHFAIAGADDKYVNATALIKNNQVEVSSNEIKNPIAVKYAWADNPENVNFYNNEGLPASPFSTQTAKPIAAWHGKKCAVVLTYDDAINQHLDNAIPILDSLGLKATFYITAFSTSMQSLLNDWKKLTVKGHELGNHTLFHPCVGGVGREWVSKQNDLRNYSVKRMENEMRMTNLFLQSLDGKTKRTFAFTCGDMKIDDSSFINGMKNDFVAARAVRNEMHKINEVDLYNVDCYMVNNHTVEQMKEWVDKAMQTNSLLVILFHGVGGGNGLDVSLDAHRQILNYIKQKEKEIYVAPMIEVAEHIASWQINNKQ